MRIPHTPMKQRDVALAFACAARRIVYTARDREQMEAQIATARYALGVPADLGAAQIEHWWVKERHRRAAVARALYQHLRAKHARPRVAKTRPVFKFVKR